MENQLKTTTYYCCIIYLIRKSFYTLNLASICHRHGPECSLIGTVRVLTGEGEIHCLN